MAKVFAHFDGHGVLSALIAQRAMGYEIVAEYPKTGPSNWDWLISQIKDGDMVIDIAPDARSPEHMKELISTAPRFIWIDEHEWPEGLEQIAIARGIEVFRTNSSFETSLMPLVLRTQKLDIREIKRLRKLARLGAICDRDPTITDVKKEDILYANAIDILVRKFKGFSPELIDYLKHPSKLLSVPGGPEIPTGVQIFVRKGLIEIKDAVPNEKGFAMKNVELILMHKEIPYAVFHAYIPRYDTFNVYLIKAVYVKGPNVIPLIEYRLRAIAEKYGKTLLYKGTMAQIIGFKDETTAYHAQKEVAHAISSVLSREVVNISREELEQIIEDAVRRVISG